MPAPAPTADIDVVDERNRAIGTAQRREVLSEGLNFRTVHVLVTDGERDLLLQRLGPGSDRHPGLWGSSVAGYLFAGESYADAAQRRMAEEIGIDADLDFLGVTPMTDERSIKFIGVFRAVTERAAPRVLDPVHVDSLRWMPVAELTEAIRTEPQVFTATLTHVISFVRGEEISLI